MVGKKSTLKVHRRKEILHSKLYTTFPLTEMLMFWGIYIFNKSKKVNPDVNTSCDAWLPYIVSPIFGSHDSLTTTA